MLIAQITDIHLGFEPDSPAEFNRQRLDRTLERLAALDPLPDLLLATGDLVDRGDVDSYRRLKEAFADLPFPVEMCLGNHDDRANYAAVFPQRAYVGGFLQYTLAAGPLRLIVLDTLEPGRHGGAFCEARAAWLRAALDTDTVTPTLIVQHHPPVEVGIAWMNTAPGEPWVHRLGACLAGRENVIGLMCGHIHRATSCHWQGLTVATCASTAPQVTLDLRAIDPARPDNRAMIVAEPPAFALHFWNGREIVTHWDTAQEYPVLARFDANLAQMVSEMLAERPI